MSPHSLMAYLTAFEADVSGGSRRSLALLNTDRLKDLGAHVLAQFDPARHDLSELIGFTKGAAAAFQYERERVKTEFVWTGPSTSQVHPRRSEQVLLDLIDRAHNELLIVSYLTLGAGGIYQRLNAAIQRKVTVNVVLDSSRELGGSLNYDPVATMRRDVPYANYHRWVDRKDEFEEASVHAKVFLADREQLLITSANLTGRALERNMEAGVLMKGGRLPRLIAAHFEELMEDGVLQLARN